MRLKSIKYKEHVGGNNEWTLGELLLGELNLIVGKNASGKTRALNIIHGLSQMLWNGRRVSNGEYEAVFDDNGASLNYVLAISDNKVEVEELTIDGKVLLLRGSGGYGKIWAEKLDQMVDFQTPETQLAAVSREDLVQHPFLTSLIAWAHSTYHYAFSMEMGHRHLVAILPDGPQADFHDSNMVVPIYVKARREHPQIDNLIISDMRKLGYNISSIGLAAPTVVQIQAGAPIQTLVVQEDDLPVPTEQLAMSTGMFRALSVIIQVNYGHLAGTHGCILIDDIGEGLDFERSKALINVISDHCQKSNIQVVMTSNDRFVMNAVKLQNWTVLKRKGNTVTPLNYTNSKSEFDEFRYTGLSNFDFFSRDFLGTTN